VDLKLPVNDEFSNRVTQIRPLTDFTSQVLLRPMQFPALSYQAGQYVNVLHQDQRISPMSIACAPNDLSVLEFHVAHPPGNLLAHDLMRIAREEQIWRLTGPFGSCTVNRMHSDRPIIFLARGTGLAPVKALIEAFIRLPLYPAISFYWSVSRQSYLYMTDLLEKWRLQIPDFIYTPVVLDQETAVPRALLETVLRDHPDLSTYQVYASGSSAFVYAVFPELHYCGLETAYFYSDAL
jgi:CDP-4-dehydro-6-deoxyglucose reductase